MVLKKLICFSLFLLLFSNCSSSAYAVQYHITDHLGSVRVVLDQNMKVLEQNDYYPFGMRHQNASLKTTANRYRYNGKEEISATATSDYGARQYSAEFCQWMQVDPHSENYYNTSSYAYCHNNPILLFDKNGMDDYYDMNGNLINHRDNDSNIKFVIQNNKEVRALKKGNIDYGSLTSATELPSDVTLQTSLDVLQRTIDNGGLCEESALVSYDGTVVYGTRGAPMKEGDEVATSKLPSYPDWQYTMAETEASVHSHPTAIVGNYCSQADIPGPGDPLVFSQYNTNIIVGKEGNNSGYRPYVICIYNRDGSKRIQMTPNSVKNILK